MESITLIDPQKGEQTAQADEIAWLHKLATAAFMVVFADEVVVTDDTFPVPCIDNVGLHSRRRPECLATGAGDSADNSGAASKFRGSHRRFCEIPGFDQRCAPTPQQHRPQA
jgi:hypothetical protein